ncbi:IS256 family transposase [Mycoplasma aquilae ATCC BAA-1896]|uniref:IS256 family transposase n=1 Tax=Mycoplasma aquilae TaxID=1312741 RepID=UPI003A85A0F2
MNNFKLLNSEQLQKFYKETTDINHLMSLLLNQYKSDIQEIINELLKDGLTEFLQYEKYERSDNANYRNGYYTRKLLLEIGEIEIQIPRDRNGDFENKLIKKHQRTQKQVTEMIQILFKKGLDYSEIIDIVNEMFGKEFSKQSITNITNNLIHNIEEFRQRRLKKEYKVIYLDATHLSVKRDGSYQKEAVHIALGISAEGYKEILAFEIYPNESANNYGDILEDIKNRGVEKVDIFITDGLAGIKDVIHRHFPEAYYQRCWVHIQRNIHSKVKRAHITEITQDIKLIYNQTDEDMAIKKFNEFLNKWKNIYPSIVRNLLSIGDDLFSFYAFPYEIRKSLYTTNLIEAFNSYIKKQLKGKKQFSTVNSAEKILITIIDSYNAKNSSRRHMGFKNI